MEPHRRELQGANSRGLLQFYGAGSGVGVEDYLPAGNALGYNPAVMSIGTCVVLGVVARR